MRTALLVEDDLASRRAIARRLQEAGWRVLEASDGESAISLALEHRPQLILCDLFMPRPNGFQVCRTIRQQLPHTRILVTSGQDYPIDRMNAQEAGADHYLVKPVEWKDLAPLINDIDDAAAVKQVARGGPTPHSLQIGSLPPSYVRFWGVRGSIPTPGAATVRYGGNTSCVEVRADGELIILDAGTGIRPLGLSLDAEFAGQPLQATILITHTHWDHIQGLPFFVPAYNPKNRLRILGYEGSRTSLATVLSGQMESPYFPVNLHQMPGHITIEEMRDMDFAVGRVAVRAKFVNHPGVCVGYRLFTSGGASIAYLPDNEPFQRLRQQPAASSSAGHTPYRSIEFARAEDRKLVDFVRGADVLIIDSQYDANEYSSHVGWGHGCLDDVVDLAIEAEVERLFLFHHDPSHGDERIDEFVTHARQLAASRGQATLTIDAAREGEEIILQPVAGRVAREKSTPAEAE